MKPTERARAKIEVLKQLGVADKVIAGYLGVHPSTFSRWWRGELDSKGNPAKLPAEALDRLEDYVAKFRVLVDDPVNDKEAQPVPSTAGPTFPDSERRTGDDRRHADRRKTG